MVKVLVIDRLTGVTSLGIGVPVAHPSLDAFGALNHNHNIYIEKESLLPS